MKSIMTIIEAILYVSVMVLPITTFILIRTVKQENLRLIKEAVTNPIFPNLDLSFFSKLQNEYSRITGHFFLPILNKLSFYLSLICLALLFTAAVIQSLKSQ